MIGQKKIIEEFDGTINISSNIKANKRTIIGKFDLRDILFILIAIVIGVIIATFLFAINMIKNLFVDFMVLAIFEVPIITIGFMKIHNMHFLDYIKLKEKSDNKSFRSQRVIRKNDKKNEYIISLEVIDKGNITNDIENVVNEIRKYLFFKDLQIKFVKNKIFISMKLDAHNINLKTFGKNNKNEVIHETDYKGLFNYFHNNQNIKFISFDDMCIYDLFIRSLKIINKKYTKDQDKIISKLKSKLLNIKIPDNTYEENLLNDKRNNRNIKINKYNLENYLDITKTILEDRNLDKIKVYKIILYNAPFNTLFLDEIKGKYDVTIYASIKDILNISEISFNETYISIFGDEKDVINKSEELELLFQKYKILYKTINEDKVKDTINFFMENKY